MGVLWRKSGQVELDLSGERASGALVYFFEGGTTTPLTVYQDAGENTAHPHPVVANAIGRYPAIFIPFTASYDEKIVTEGGTQLSYYLSIPNPNPVEAAAASVDDEELLQTGHVWWEPVNETKVGAVRLNGRTIGNAASGATERANADTEDLFTYLWNKLANAQAAVSSGRGASAAADYAANKTITLLDGRSGVLRGLDDMGNSAASRLGFTTFTNGDATTAGSALGANSHVITEAQLPVHSHNISLTSASNGSHNHAGSTADPNGAHVHGVTDPGHTHTIPQDHQTTITHTGSAPVILPPGVADQVTDSALTGISIDSGGAHAHNLSIVTEAAHTHSVVGATDSVGSGTAHNNVSYGLLGTFYQKL